MPDAERSPLAAADDDVRRLTEELALAPSTLGAVLLALAGQLRGGLSVKDAVSGRYRYVNEPLARLFGRVPADMVGRIDAELIEPAAWVPLQAVEQRAALSAVAHTHRHRIELGGRMRDVDVTRLRLGDTSGPVLALWIERTEQRDREQRLRDALRQLERRTAEAAAVAAGSAAGSGAARPPRARVEFDDQLRRELDLSEREQREFSLVTVQVDGTAVGEPARDADGRERVELALGRLVTRSTRAMDGCCPLGEAGYMILLSGVGLATAHARAEDLRRQCATEIVAHGGEALRFTVSMGVASFPHTAADRDALIAASGAALHRARERGGNQVALAGIRFAARRE